jgi:HD-like signal output (HDOD) protein
LCDLPASAAPTAPAPPAARLILDELARLSRAPGEAADLVPRVPDVIPRLLRSLRDEAVSGAELARQVTKDAVLVAEVIREANSPFYRPAKPVRTVDAAILVLGQNGLRMLLARVAFRPIFRTTAGRRARLVAPRLWQHSERCARACALLAPPLGADPFEGYLSGLMLDVGLIVAFRLIDQLHEDGPLPRESAAVAAILAGARELSARIALFWELPPPIGAAILRAGQSGAQPLALALGQADQLARLRLLFDQGALVEDDPLLAALNGPAARVFERLAPEPD